MVNELVECKPDQHRGGASQHLLYHHVEVKYSDQQHEVPQQHQESHQAEQGPHHGGSFGVLRPKLCIKLDLKS